MTRRLLLSALALFITTSDSHLQASNSEANIEVFVGSEFRGTVDGQGTRTMFESPGPLTFDGSGNLYCLQEGVKIRKITPDATVSTIEFPHESLSRILSSKEGRLLVTSYGTAYEIENGRFEQRLSIPGGALLLWNETERTYFAASDTKILRYESGSFQPFAGSGNSANIDGD